ncbi:SusC/RagA family TonB-linked outer membrane protein [Chitinophaga sp. sic0106]|uniref:SusC/RagA family TonB-linked outer membrane protein n=1 Tax=Chitinophaga sp. sic0106 TaxID=2854785 RepID=UPI001C459ADC|nr:SusC/RagA family TonB-linked outer membrane protein [Chitinophaga sp. sic0106]MBV7533014.1 SusC/RagA family TonB-linked outer membrane protein [Chitinophaga sp. sic0106]
MDPFYLLKDGKPLFKSALFLLLMVTFLLAPAGIKAQTTVNLNEKNARLEAVIARIGQQTGYDFVINTRLLKSAPPIDANFRNLRLEEALKICLANLPLEYVIQEKTVIIKEKAVAAPRKERVKGLVTDEKQSPIPGASVIELGSNNRTITNNKGEFELAVAGNNTTLLVSNIGYDKREIHVDANTGLIKIALKENVTSLGGVDVTIKNGYYEKSRQTFTGAATSFTGEQLRTVTNQNILAALSTLDPSFKLVENNLIGSDPNQLPDFQIRGSSSISSGLEEKYKGNPNLPVFMLDGFEVSLEKIYDLDPQRISGVTILKDAAALAIYGSRGANGVVVISTYTPLAGKLRVTYNANIDFDVADLSDYHLLGAADKLAYEKLAGIYTPGSAVYVGEKYDYLYNERLKMVQQGTNTDWIKKPVKDVGVNTRHTVTLEGGDRAFRYGLSVYCNPSEGVMKGSDRNRKGINVNLTYNYKNLKFSNQLSFDNVISRQSPYGSFSTYAYLNPYYSPYNSKGELTKILYTLESVRNAVVTIPNPLYNTTINTKNQSKYDNFINNFRVEWNLTNALKLNGTFSINKKTQISDDFRPSDHTDFIGATTKGRYVKSTGETMQYEGTAGLSYMKAFSKNLLVVNANYNIRQVANDLYSVTAAGFPNDLMDHVGMGLEYLEGSRPQGSESTSRLLGVLTNVNYSYDNRFLADFAIRADGSSQFGSNKRWGAFWSAGLGWNLHQENFLKNSHVVNLLKVRGSVGYTGSQNFYPYQAELTYNYLPDVTYDDNIGAVASAYGNNNLRWQKTQKRNVGVDFELLKSRITGYFNYYSDYSKDVLVDVTMPPSLGFTTYKANLGEVQNKGYEISLRGTLLSQPAKKQYLNVFALAVHNTNSLRKLSNALKAFNDQADSSVGNKPSVRFIEGASINTIWVVKSLGIDPATGEEVFVDKSGKITNVWNATNYIPYGTVDPKLEGTFGSSFGHRGFELNIYFHYKFGGYIYNNTLVDRVENVNPNQNVDSRVFYDRWKQPGDISRFKSITNTALTRPTSRFVEKDDLLELKSVNLSYSFRDQPFMKKIGAQNLRVSAILNDVFRASSVKAERGIDYPFARHFALALQATF